MTALFAGRRTRKGIGAGIALALLAGLGLGLGGCGIPEVVPPLAIAAGVEGVSLNQTGKTASDHIASWVTGQDCSVLRSSKDGGSYCRSAAELAKADAELHRPYLGDCYRVRGGVACYDQPDATHTSETSVYNAP
ncbi:MAG TPA: hypothetical protein VHA35_02165 [Dongiaceae bacterium]|jgi:hypothetical protein|nr:hypothetical protein [Dongiaceae bacterium]